MASNDGARMTVLGLTFGQHHTLHMQQVLRAYERLPENLMNRGALYAGLFELAKELSAEETQNLEHWLQHGGQFPAPPSRNPPTTQGGPSNPRGLNDDDQGDEEAWPEYHPEDFVRAGSEIEEDEDDDDDEDEDEVSGNPEEEHDEDSEDDDSDEDHPPQNRPHPRTIPGQQKQKPTADLVECAICAESYYLEDFPPSTQITSTCKHDDKSRACYYCLQQTIATAVAEGLLHLIICPFCPAKLSHNEVKQFATKEVFARFEYLRANANPDMVMCMGPDCGSGQIHVDEDPMMICEACSFKTCAKHKWPWHEGQTCEEFDVDDKQIERLEEAEATAKLLAKEHAQICPNCQNVVSRIDGCDHMTCRCGNEWCYICGVSYEKVKHIGEEAHAPTCIYNPRRVQVRRDQERAVQSQFTQMVHGGPVSEALERARGQRNERIRAEMRPLAALAAERRMKEMEQKKKEDPQIEKKRKRNLNMHAPWEEH